MSIECAFSGRVGKEPELRTSQAGKNWCWFTVAISAGSTGSDDAATQWVKVACFGDVAEDLAASLPKGTKVYVEGTIKLSQWTKDGEQHAGLDCAARVVQPMGMIGNKKPRRKRADTQARRTYWRPAETGNGARAAMAPMADDPLPF